jgi:hypothetical protein
MRRSIMSARIDPTIPSLSDRLPTILDGSATQTRTKKNSNGPCSHDVSNKRIKRVNPPSSDASINVAPRLKNPTKPPVNNENVVSNWFLAWSRRGGVHRTFAIIRGYRKDNTTGTQLFAKMRSVTATSPTALAARTGMIARVFSKNAMKLRNGARRAVSNEPAKEPRMRAASVPPKALSTYLKFRISPASAMYHQGV